MQFIAGVFLVLAGLQTDEQEVRSLGDALSAILDLAFSGNFLLGVVAVGLVTYVCSWSPSPATAASRRAMPSRRASILGSMVTGILENCSEPFMRVEATGKVLDAVTAEDALGFFTHCGYCKLEQRS